MGCPHFMVCWARGHRICMLTHPWFLLHGYEAFYLQPLHPSVTWTQSPGSFLWHWLKYKHRPPEVLKVIMKSRGASPLPSSIWLCGDRTGTALTARKFWNTSIDADTRGSGQESRCSRLQVLTGDSDTLGIMKMEGRTVWLQWLWKRPNLKYQTKMLQTKLFNQIRLYF